MCHKAVLSSDLQELLSIGKNPVGDGGASEGATSIFVKIGI
jgi:hypothetical protein